MGVLTSFIASTSAGGLIALLLFLGFLFLNYWATLRIITKAGFSPVWIVLPLVPLVLTIICYVMLWNDLHAIIFGSSFGFGGIGNIKIFWRLDKLSLLLNWIFYLVFAFSRWPVSGTTHTRDPEPSPPPRAVRANQPGPSADPARPNPVGVARYAAPVTGAGPAVAPSAPVAKGKHCAWCGESLPGSRALFHDCGPKDRPETFCKNCGAELSPGTTQCSSCGSA
jgi:hypothetical protein